MEKKKLAKILIKVWHWPQINHDATPLLVNTLKLGIFYKQCEFDIVQVTREKIDGCLNAFEHPLERYVLHAFKWIN